MLLRRCIGSLSALVVLGSGLAAALPGCASPSSGGEVVLGGGDVPADDDSAGDDDSAEDVPPERSVEALGLAALAPSGGPYTDWAGTETYEERDYLTGEVRCALEFSTAGIAGTCEGCTFAFEVTYAAVAGGDASGCASGYAPADGETWTLVYREDAELGGTLSYVVEYHAYPVEAFWGYATRNGDDLEYWFEGFLY